MAKTATAENRPISLPMLPKGKELEEYIAAHFNCAGVYVDRSLIMRTGSGKGHAEILELDLNVTNYLVTPPEMVLVEVKSGDWGMSDVFKIRGWMDFLNLKKGVFIATRDRAEFDQYERVAQQLGITLVLVSDLAQTAAKLNPVSPNLAVDERDVQVWRFAYWTEQAMLDRLKQKRKTQPNVKRYAAMETYINEINNGIFFRRTILDRARRCYDLFSENPYLSAKCACEELGDAFDGDHQMIPPSLFKRTYYGPEYTDLQVSAYIENRARLAVLKSAVDYCLYKKAGDKSQTDASLELLGMKVSLAHFLPGTFKSALPELEKQPYFHLYPVFWQWFLWVFGGFILLDREVQEFELLSLKTGIPVEALPDALNAFDLLFPTKGGWMRENGKTAMKMMKVMSVPFHGVGAKYRRLYYCPNSQFDELNLTERYARNDIAKWNNLVCDVLRASDRYRDQLVAE
jgi:hypothetical protein